MPGTRFTDIRHFETIDSTNRYLLEEARSGAPDGVVAVADFQTAGRGRLGRRWEAPAGVNLLLSVLLRPDLPSTDRYLASAVVALASADAAESVTGLSLGLKWPNDLLGPDGRKVAGVLAESDLAPGPELGDRATPAGTGAAIVVGVGVNVGWPATEADLPPELVGSATSLSRLAGYPVDRTRILAELLEALEPRLVDLGSGPGRARQSDDVRRRCTTIGTPVRIDLAHSSFEGLAVDVTAEGHLVVEVDGRPRIVVAGDVVHVRPPAAPHS
jgi:BirA family biotin operon repressor/biotin-[acetyl-CoA-carboxylase] ligase